MKAFPRWWSTREDSLCCQRSYRNSVPHRKRAGCKSAWTLALDRNYFPKKRRPIRRRHKVSEPAGACLTRPSRRGVAAWIRRPF